VGDGKDFKDFLLEEFRLERAAPKGAIISWT
jgi:hypothetical protein